jgi:predicted nucleotidyltransferase
LANKTIAAAIGALERALSGTRHMLIGGIAVVARGVRRLTDDVDATVWGEGVVLEELFDRLASQRIVPRIANAGAFARRNQVLLARHEPSGVDIDLSLAWLSFESAALDRADQIAIGRQRVRVATATDLIIYKAIAARERDLSDIERLLEIHGSTIDLRRARRTVAELGGILERPELLQGLERLAKKSRRALKPARPARARVRAARPRVKPKRE